jgi:hypothetical protein
MSKLHGAAPVFVVADILRSIEYYRDLLGFDTEFVYGEPTFYAGVERDNVLIDMDALYEELKARGARLLNAPKDYAYGMRDFNAVDLDGNELCIGMESRR